MVGKHVLVESRGVIVNHLSNGSERTGIFLITNIQTLCLSSKTQNNVKLHGKKMWKSLADFRHYLVKSFKLHVDNTM